MSSSTHPIIILSDSNVEDAFSSTNTPDYIPASPDYSPASPGNTSPDPSKDLSKDLFASLANSPFNDDPYIKVMKAYNASSNELPIPSLRAPIDPPTILPLSPVLPPSPLFDPRDFFLPEEILPPQKPARFLSPFSTDSSAPPQVETILNHLDELPLERIEHMEDKIEGLGNGRREQIRHDDQIVLARVRTFTLEILIEDIQCDVSYLYVSRMAPKRTSTSVAPAMSQAAIRKLDADSVAATLEVQAATMENSDNTNRNTGQY
ncbi:hypothetical protein Tco_1089995 [Tanacetum coccineum]|uniref:Uncharacterized protein n=1 Tax=Tanacetum coccineum TaxID=301880 RepID=A0ABQ5I527_9ASTR